jgi:hypothetical protein
MCPADELKEIRLKIASSLHLHHCEREITGTSSATPQVKATSSTFEDYFAPRNNAEHTHTVTQRNEAISCFYAKSYRVQQEILRKVTSERLRSRKSFGKSLRSGSEAENLLESDFGAAPKRKIFWKVTSERLRSRKSFGK